MFTAVAVTDRTVRPPTIVTTVTALKWNPEAHTYTPTVGTVPSGVNMQANLVWDGSAVYALTLRPGDIASVLQRWAFDGSGWVHQSLPLPVGVGAAASTFYRPSDAI